MENLESIGPSSEWRYRLRTYGREAFSFAAATVWNSLPEDLRYPECSVDTYTDSRWRHFYFHSTNVSSALEVLMWVRYINLHLTLIAVVCVFVSRFSEHGEEQRDKQSETLQGVQCRLHARRHKVRDFHFTSEFMAIIACYHITAPSFGLRLRGYVSLHLHTQ